MSIVRAIKAMAAASFCVALSAGAAQAKTVCNNGAVRDAGVGNWGTASSCQCGEPYVIKGRVWGKVGAVDAIAIAAIGGAPTNEVWGATYVENSDGNGSWIYPVGWDPDTLLPRDLPGGVSSVVFEMAPRPDEFWTGKFIAVCAK